nr:ribonuclease H-like domain-containing protein [Tanacetum cinerariifolium]
MTFCQECLGVTRPGSNIPMRPNLGVLHESNLWHRRLGHINFKTMNKLVKGNLVRGLPSKVFENDNTCVACKQGKQHGATCKTKPVSSVNQPLYRLHMDLFGPTFVKSLNKKSYCLVVIDDYSRFTWVFFLATKDETSPILKTFITGLENQLSLKVKVIKSDNGTEFQNNDLNQFCGMKGIKREFSKFDGKVDEGFLVGYSVSSKAFRVFNSRTRIIQETLHVNFLENRPNVAGVKEKFDAEKAEEESIQQYVFFPVWSSGSTNPQNTDGDAAFDEKEPEFEGKKLESEVNISPSSSAQSKKHDDKTKREAKGKSPVDSAQSKKHDDKTKREAKGKSPVESLTGYRNLSAEFEDFSDNSINEDNAAGILVPDVAQLSPNNTNTFSAAELEDVTYSNDEDDVGTEPDFNNLETSITVSPIPTTRVHKDHHVTQIIGDLSSATQTRSMTRVARDQGGLSQEEPKRVHQALKDPSWIEAMQEELLQFKMQKVLDCGQEQSSTCCTRTHRRRELIMKKSLLQLTDGKSASSPIDSEKPLLKDPDGEDVDVHIYRSMIGSLMYLTSSRPYIMFAVCACARFQVTPKVSHLHAVKRIIRYLKGKPYLGLWYPKDSLFNLVAYSDSDYAGASLDNKSTTGGCQFLGCRLISWQCKK